MNHKIHKRVSRKMISQLNHVLFSSNIYVCQSGGSSSVSQSLQAFTFMRIRYFQSSGPTQYPKATVIESTSQTLSSLNAIKISRVARSDAQAALFEYLHYTRGFNFVNDEHITKSSPCSLQKLLSKVQNEDDVSRELSRFLRYLPINEFEPFFESLGLSPNEIALLLPRNLMFLTDNHVLLDNYHVLSSYGIPRSNIGKIYKKATEIFQYGDGVLNMKLMACEKLGLSRSTIIKLVSCSPTVLVGDVNNELFEVIEKLKKMGFGTDWIGSYLSSEHSYNWSRILGKTFFLSEVGYNEPHMGTLFRANPALLFEGSGKCTYVLVAQLVNQGLNKVEIHSLLLEYPKILSLKYTKRLWKAMNFLFEIRM